MKKRSVLIVAMLGLLLLAACGQTGKDLAGLSDLDPSELSNAGEQLRAAGAMCSEAAGQVSGLSQEILKAAKAGDLAAAQAAAVQLADVADALHQSAEKGVAAAQGLSSLPGEAGTQAVDGTSSGFKQCGRLGDFAADLSTKVANASPEDVDAEMQKAVSKLMDEAAEAGQGVADAGSTT